MIVVGTTALKFHGIDLRPCKESDLDIICSSSSIIEIAAIKEKFNCLQIDLIELPEHIVEILPFTFSENDDIIFKKYATVDAIYTLKLSHLAWDIKWQKHKSDVLRLKKLGAKKIVKLYDALVKYWESTNTDKDRLNLYMKKSDFFNDYVPYVYDHDYLHEVVALPHKPVYSLCLKDGYDVAIDKDKFFALPKELQLRMFKEEITVIAAERWLIPERKKKYHWLHAYSLSVHKTITALTKGWASQFMIDNVEYYIKPDFTMFKKLIDKGIIKMSNKLEQKEMETILLEVYNAWVHYEEKSEEVFVEYDDRMSGELVWEMGDFVYDGGTFVRIDDYGGEGMGEYAWLIFQWKDKFYKYEYNYYSNDGYNFDYATMTIVTPVQETVTVYK